MSGANREWLRSPAAKGLLLAALAMSLTLGVGFIIVDKVVKTQPRIDVQTPLTDAQAAAQVLGPAREIVTAARLQSVNAGYIFLSCTNEHDPPYQAAVYLTFRLPDTNAVRRIAEIADAMKENGWREASTTAEHFGAKLTKDNITSTFHQNLDDPGFGTMRIYGECRNTADHRNDNPAWTDVTDELG